MALNLVESLVQQCYHYIAMHLEEFPINHLSLLPLSKRRDLLWRLPVADVCLRLENTAFTEGLDMEAFWKYSWRDERVDVAGSSSDSDVKGYFQTWNEAKYARAVLYGLAATMAIGKLRDGDFAFHSPLYGRSTTGYRENVGMPIFTFLYAVRKPYHIQHVHQYTHCYLIFPPRYLHKSNKDNDDLTENEVVNCFSSSGEFPRIFPEIGISARPGLLVAIDPGLVYLFRNARYLAFEGYPLDKLAIEFLQAVLNEAVNLEVLILDQWGYEYEWEEEMFDGFCPLLSYSHTFLSNFRLFKIFSSDSKGFAVSQKNFNQLITAYFAAPTEHEQKLQITHTMIKCSNVPFDCRPKIDQRYLAFKTVELVDCQFVCEYKATPQTVSRWLGQDINELPQSNSSHLAASCYFKVKEKIVDHPIKKRKHSELDSEEQ